MIRRQNKLKYIFVVLCELFVFSSLIGAYAAHYYTKTRMGMLRHVIYLNGKWEENLPINTMKWITIILIIGFVIFAITRYFSKRVNSISNKLLILSIVVISTWTVYYIIVNNTEANPAYYIISICLVIGTIIQNILYQIHWSIRKNRHI